MKKGKTSKINGFRSSKVSYGTVDSKEFKSLYLNIQTWVEPKKEVENWTRVVLNLTRAIKHSLYENLDKNLYDEKFIVDLDLRTSGISLNKRSFMNLEVTFFVKNDTDFKSSELKNELKNIISTIEKDCFKNSKYFKFYLTKKDKLNTTDKIESI